MPELSVVIVNYNTRDLLRACLASLQQSEDITLEIIVVDNASTDDSASMVANEFPNVILLAQSVNTWYCGGNNIGIDHATSDYILLLNPDTVVSKTALRQMLDFLKNSADCAGVTAQLRYPDGTIQHTCSRIPTFADLLASTTILGWLFRGWKQRRHDHYQYADWNRTSDKDVEVIPGSCTLMRKGEIRYDDDLLLYFPEDTLARQVKRPFRYFASVHIEHHEKSVTQTWTATQIYFRDMLTYIRKHEGWLKMAFLWLLSRPILWGIQVKRILSRKI